MELKFNQWSFYLTFLCVGLSFYSFYSYLESFWLLAPPSYILLGISVIALVFGILGLKAHRYRWAKLRSGITLSLSLLLSIILSLTIILTWLFSILEPDNPTKTTHSPNGDYTINFYKWNEGATGGFGIRGELDGPLWFKKKIYFQEYAEDVQVVWESNDKVSINNQILDLGNGDTFGYDWLR
ncbi:DUF5412 family protein [Metabacillus malikii]|uniref:DUF4178 domain-containing protein n=1 Tax=Metabacillus malikii TaxID=1504265 RepID=A0ABT9ZLV6_9BACI|nr:DUF5412 family protein [Metabacillus malikii]MDQ0233278.1 hypothetical protein [Metabacillus malikii]